MSMFAKRIPLPRHGEPTMADNGQPMKSKLQGALDHINAAHHHLGEAMNLFSMINFDLQKGADFISRYRDMLVNAIESAGGKIEQDSVEEQIKEFLPKAIQRGAPPAPKDEV